MSDFRKAPIAPGIAFVTGGARGLGNAVAVSFAKIGAKGVALIDIQDEKTSSEGKAAVEKAGAKCITIHCDVTDESQVEAAVKQVVEEFGRIDYAANFAGISGPLDVSWETDTKRWRQVIDVNCFGVWLCMKHELMQMLKQSSIDVEQGRVPQQGAIVNCASVNSIQAGAGATGYTAAKHAVNGITKAGALEARSHNIKVNAVSPGFLRTQLLDQEFQKVEKNMGASAAESIWAQFEGRQGRQATFDEVGDVVVLLCSPRMSLVNGTNLPVDGGFTINESNT